MTGCTAAILVKNFSLTNIALWRAVSEKSDVPVHLHTAIRTYYLLSEIKVIRQLYMDSLNNAHYQKSPCVTENQLVTFISSNVVGGSLSTLCHTTFGIVTFIFLLYTNTLTYLLTFGHSKLIISNRPSKPLSSFLLVSQIRPLLTTVCIYNYVYLLTICWS